GIYCDAGVLRSCLVYSNAAAANAGGVYLAAGAVACNLTVADNSAVGSAGGAYVAAAQLWNSIVWRNTAATDGNCMNAAAAAISHCCTTPDPGGTAIITNDPLMLTGYGIDFASPCVAQGWLFDWMDVALDLAGEPRVQGGTPDIGAYEAVPEPACLILGAALAGAFLRRRQPRGSFAPPRRRGEGRQEDERQNHDCQRWA
ncbi:hypothetical protein GX586_06870, partial [bacterium]|nr:hypothetical protein [bacterium]